MKTNKQRAIEICKTVLKAYDEKQGLFSDPDIEKRMLPEGQLISALPDSDKELIARWLFFTCPGDKLIDSTKYYEQLKIFYEHHPDFFDMENLKDPVFLSSGLEEFVEEVKVATPNEFIRFTVFNIEKLISDFNGNPISMLTDEYESSMKNLKQFLGYRKEIASLYLLFLTRYNIKKIKDLVPKIDRHFLKISVGCDVIKIENGMREDKATRILSELYTQICREQGFDALTLDPTTWITGHELCSREDGESCETLCPLDAYCSRELPMINRKDATLHYKASKRNQLFLPLKC